MNNDQRLQADVDRILGSPDLYPDEMKVWVVRWVQDNPNFRLPTTALPLVEQIKYIGTTGEPAFQNSWAAYGGGYEDPGYYKDPFGRVHLCGHMKSGTINTVAFTLPTGYRPKARTMFTSISSGDTGFRVDVLSTGDVIPVTGTNPYISLNGINFRDFA